MSLAHPDPTLGELFADLAKKTGSLVRQEVQLARTEVTAQATSAAGDLGWIGAGGALAHAGLLAIVAAIIALLGIVVPMWLSALVIGLVLAGAGYCLIQKGVHSLRRIEPVPRTRESLREDKALLQEQIR